MKLVHLRYPHGAVWQMLSPSASLGLALASGCHELCECMCMEYVLEFKAQSKWRAVRQCECERGWTASWPAQRGASCEMNTVALSRLNGNGDSWRGASWTLDGEHLLKQLLLTNYRRHPNSQTRGRRHVTSVTVD